MSYSKDSVEISLFPLYAVLLPGSKMTLQIAEKRYQDLITSSLRDNTGFGINLLKDLQQVSKVGLLQDVYRVGTYAKIIDWNPQNNGLLGVTVEGLNKYKIDDYWVGEDDLLIANVRFSDIDFVGKKSIPLEDDASGLNALLQLLQQHPATQDADIPIDYAVLWELGWRLSEIIPVAREIKQKILEIDDPWQRIKVMDNAIRFLADDFVFENTRKP